MTALAVLILSYTGLMFCLYMLFRNNRVCAFSIWAIEHRIKTPDYDVMLWQFWVWPLTRFIKDKSP